MGRMSVTNRGSLISVNGVAVPKGCSTLSIVYQDLSDADAGRGALDGTMWKGYIGTVRTLQCAWNSMYPDHIRDILMAVRASNGFPVEFYDAETGKYAKRDFNVGDRTCDFQCFYKNHELIGLKMNLTEVEAYNPNLTQ